MNELQIFNNEKYGEIRTSIINGEPYFMLADVCRVLEIGNPTMTKQRLNKNGVNSIEVIDNLGRPQQATFINESNLYKLVFTSRKKEAEEFTEWVTSEVLPSIRKHGMYMTSSVAQQAINNPTEFLARAVLVANQELDKNVKGFDLETQKKFKAYSWPGNIRELRTIVKRAVLLAKDDWITAEDVGLLSNERLNVE